MDETPQRVLVVVPHPEDAEFWCGGTVAKWIDEGAMVRYVLCTDGAKGATDPNVTSQELGVILPFQVPSKIPVLKKEYNVIKTHLLN